LLFILFSVHTERGIWFFLIDPKASAVLLQYADTLLFIIVYCRTDIRQQFNRQSIDHNCSPRADPVCLLRFGLYQVRQSSGYSISLLTLLSLAVMYMHKNKKGTDSLLFWSILSMLAAGLAGLYPGSRILGMAALV
jgi:hypothetical protein